uniref:Lipase maturation factor n=1 Tax=Alexandrium monilatum TaxID=311494 RepID=A0A7S4SR64_9DINO|mmetsp:Transcript_29555/g.92232  ORF Transcript_29555/g.92232 Transcript_29555/m.92232 type:complete len:785 (+) Transcript_29555:66-2420(+)
MAPPLPTWLLPLLRSALADWMGPWIELAWAEFLHFWRAEVPKLLSLLARSLSRAKIPASVVEAKGFTMGDWLDAAPVLAGIAACVATPVALLLGDDARVRELRRERGSPAEADLSNSYWLTREALLSGMGLCYLCGFLVSALQHRALWGSLGLTPLSRRPRGAGGRPTPAFEFLEHLGWGFGDWQLELVSWLGAALALQLLVGRLRTALVPAACWVLYLSIVNLQAPFTYSYGWEWLTCEVGFLAIFLCPLYSRGLRSWTPPPRLVLWLIRWCAFRLLLGAGMSKVGRNSSACWRQLSCTETHYFTQPVPNPLAWYMHHMPESFHRVEVALTFVEQLVLPFLMLVPIRACRVLAGLLEIGFQMGIVGTGNYAWINFIGALPCVALLDDGVLCRLYTKRTVQEAREAAREAALGGAGLQRRCGRLARLARRGYGAARLLVHAALVALMVRMSAEPIKELFGPAPWINSYDEWFLMNSQGVFGFINRHRVQVVLRYTHDERLAPGSWRPLDFKCLPGSPGRRPCFMSPYHYRLDWETWIRVTASGEQLWEQRAPVEAYHQRLPEFLQTLVVRLLSGDDDAAGLMGVPARELYEGGRPPVAISVDFASYTFAGGSDPAGAWWRPEPVGAGSAWAYGGEGSRLPEDQVRKSPRQRHWILGLCAGGLGLLAEHAVLRGALPALEGAAAAAPLAHAFGIALASDYDDLWQAAMPFMPLMDRIPACLQVGRAARQRCAYEYAQWSSTVCSFAALLWALSSRGLLKLVVCGILLAVVYLSQAALEGLPAAPA